MSIYLKNVSTLELDEDMCTGCRMCEVVCPHGVFEFDNKKAVIKVLDNCMECSACAMNCPHGALRVRRGVGCASAIISSVIGKNSSKETKGTCC